MLPGSQSVWLLNRARLFLISVIAKQATLMFLLHNSSYYAIRHFFAAYLLTHINIERQIVISILLLQRNMFFFVGFMSLLINILNIYKFNGHHLSLI